MAAESCRRVGKPTGLVVRPQVVSDKSYMASVVGFINDVVPQAYSGNAKHDERESVLWAKFEWSDINDYRHFTESQQNGNIPPLLIVLGYSNGVQVWVVSANGEAQEILSWRQGPVRAVKLLPTPDLVKPNDEFFLKRPLMALVDSSSAGQQFCAANIISLRSGDQVHCIQFHEPVLELLCNRKALVATFYQKIMVFDSCTFKEMFVMKGCYPSPNPNQNPVALGSRWLAFADKKLFSVHQTAGGMTGDGVQSYAATVIHAAKTITKGLTMFGETVASSLAGTNNPPRRETKQSQDILQPGIVTIVDILKIGKGELTMDEDSEGEGLVAHFPAHTNEYLQALAFDPSGMLLLTACSLGHNFHIFGIFPHPTSSALGSVHHLYTLHRGDTTAKVQDITFSLDTRWVSVTTQRGTSHIFPITQYGGAINVRTHLSPRVVNRFSRFQKSAGLEDIQKPSTTGRNSPVLSGSPSSQGGMTSSRSYESHQGVTYQGGTLTRVGNPRLPPYPHPTTVLPLAQLKQPLSISVPGISGGSLPTGSKSPTSKGGGGSSSGLGAGGGRRSSSSSQSVNEPTVSVMTWFAPPRAWLVGSPSLNREKRDKRPVDALFVIGCHGNLIEYLLEPKPAVGFVRTNEDAPIELEVMAQSQWILSRPHESLEIKLPLSSLNPLILAQEINKPMVKTRGNKFSSFPIDQIDLSENRNNGSEDNWLSQVEIITHAGPHRRLWMGPQFSFKTIQPLSSNTNILSPNSPALLSGLSDEPSGPSSLDVYAEELDLLSLRPTRSNPVAMPPSCHRGQHQPPLLIEASSGSFEQQMGLVGGALEVIECGSLVNVPILDPNSGSAGTGGKEQRVGHLVEHLRETIADAMMETHKGEAFQGDLMSCSN